MDVMIFDKNKHMEQVLSWSKEWDFPIPQEALPTIAFIVPHVWCSWLVQTDTKIALVEPTLSNPNSTKKERDQASQLVYQALFQKAKDLGFTHLLAYTYQAAMIERALQCGASALSNQYTLLVKRI